MEGIRFNTSPESAAVSALLLGVTCTVIIVGMAVVLGRKRVAGGPSAIAVLTKLPRKVNDQFIVLRASQGDMAAVGIRRRQPLDNEFLHIGSPR